MRISLATMMILSSLMWLQEGTGWAITFVFWIISMAFLIVEIIKEND